MELFIGIVIGVVAASVGFVSAMRRAAKNPEGKTAKALKIAGGGGGPDPRVP